MSLPLEGTIELQRDRWFRMTDILTSERFTVDSGKTTRVRIPCGLFHFIDVQFQEDL